MTSPTGLRAPRRLVAASGLALAALIGGTVASALPSSPSGQWNAGSLRLSSSYATDSIAITGTQGADSEKRVIRSKITVPSGRVADVQASFSAMLLPNTGSGDFSYCNGYFTVDSQSNPDAQFRPGEQIQLLGGANSKLPNAVGVGMVGFKRNIGPGTHYINVYVRSAYEGCTLMGRALNLVVNLR